MSIARTFVDKIIPPGLRSDLSVWLGRGNRFHGGYSSWPQAASVSSGYDESSILDKVLAATRQVMRGEAVFERDSVIFRDIQAHWATLAALLWSASRSGGRLSVLDFGGSLGSSYFQHRYFLRGCAPMTWSVVEQEHFVGAGRAHVVQPELRFYSSIDECLAQQDPNVLLLSSVLQYMENPGAILRQLSATKADVMCIARTPVSVAGENQLLVQHVPASIYPASYPMWAFSKSWILALLGQHWRLVTDSASEEGTVQPRRASPFTFRDMLFERVTQ